ncbi:hypothetical protein K6Y31_07850 [Motilimonas cestriensis]|uniref:Uncharacterized protein n=1 Tax=Motilimonas cestriensis TaxID=2742685 RepID=A0ABS8W6U0_9GAMM|nr:hypothetical protein [Motilimonas cestriensis]MCE2594727.1 hypothetical protein [Motilimonas cestriensis]
MSTVKIPTVKIATTNTDGTGSANNLTDDHTVLTGVGVIDESEYEASNNNDIIDVEAAYWNAKGSKEVKIDAENVNVVTKDFVDVDLNLANSTNDVIVNVINSKRGQIETGSGDDSIALSVQTNNGGWSNLFQIDTGDGVDSVTISDAQNSQFTSLDIKTGNGGDSVNLSAMKASADASVFRIIDTGAGDDTIAGSKGADAINGGEGVDIIFAGGGDDVVTFDAADRFVDGGQGFDALVIQGRTTADIGPQFTGFEAIIGEAGSAQNIRIDLQDGLVIRLGGDAGDNVSFNELSSFTALSTEDSDALSGRFDVDTSGLQAYQTENDGNTVTIWSDTDLV